MIAGRDDRWVPRKYGPAARFQTLQRIESFGTGRRPLGGLFVGVPWRHDRRHHVRHHRWYFLGVRARGEAWRRRTRSREKVAACIVRSFIRGHEERRLALARDLVLRAHLAEVVRRYRERNERRRRQP